MISWWRGFTEILCQLLPIFSKIPVLHNNVILMLLMTTALYNITLLDPTAWYYITLLDPTAWYYINLLDSTAWYYITLLDPTARIDQHPQHPPSPQWSPTASTSAFPPASLIFTSIAISITEQNINIRKFYTTWSKTAIATYNIEEHIIYHCTSVPANAKQ